MRRLLRGCRDRYPTAFMCEHFRLMTNGGFDPHPHPAPQFGQTWEARIPTQELVHGVSPYPPIADYGFLSDGEVAALVAPSGNI